MEREDMIDFSVALAIGVAAGIAATLLMRGRVREKPLLERGVDETRRLLDELQPLKKAVHNRVGAIKDGVRKARWSPIG
jgi:hypothetical protein